MSNHYLNQTPSPIGDPTVQMKDSGTQWIGSIPSNWNVCRFKDVVSIENGKDYKEVFEEDGPIPVLGSGGVFTTCTTPLYDRPSVLLGRKGTVDRPLFVDYPFWTVDTMYYTRFKKDDDPKYVYYCATQFPFDYYQYGSAVPSMTQSDLNNIWVPRPDIMTQKKIARFLDTHCDLIDSQINALKESIDCFECLKQSVITECITKGLLSSVQLKDTGVSWIGSIPSSWDVRPVKSLFTINKRIAGSLGYDVLSITQKGIKVKDIESNEGQQSNDYSKYQIVEPGDFAMNHMDLLTGFVDLSKVLGVTSPDYRVFTPTSEDIVPEYALHIFQTAYRNKIFYGLGQGVSTLGRWRLPKEQFLNFMLPVPPVEEQRSIVSYLDKFTSSVDGLIDANNKKLNALARFKESLIFEYVTGKKQVPVEV